MNFIARFIRKHLADYRMRREALERHLRKEHVGRFMDGIGRPVAINPSDSECAGKRD